MRLSVLFAERGISGAPVVDADGRLLGMVTEGDLTRKPAATQDRPRSWLWGLLSSASRQAEHYARTHGQRARDIMTTLLATASEEDELDQVATLLEQRKVRRVSVTRDGKLVGIISRADLMLALTSPPEQAAAGVPDDARIRCDVIARMREQPWVDVYSVFTEVKNGVVILHGFCRSEEVKRGLRVLAELVPGVREATLDLEQTPPFLLGTPRDSEQMLMSGCGGDGRVGTILRQPCRAGAHPQDRVAAARAR
jgi:CBS domain-containing protein